MGNPHAMVWISFPLLQEIMTEGWEGDARCSKGLPEGARLVRTFTDEAKGVACLVFEHESFEWVPLGYELPMIDVWHTTIDGD